MMSWAYMRDSIQRASRKLNSFFRFFLYFFFLFLLLTLFLLWRFLILILPLFHLFSILLFVTIITWMSRFIFFLFLDHIIHFIRSYLHFFAFFSINSTNFFTEGLSGDYFNTIYDGTNTLLAKDQSFSIFFVSHELQKIIVSFLRAENILWRICLHLQILNK